MIIFSDVVRVFGSHVVFRTFIEFIYFVLGSAQYILPRYIFDWLPAYGEKSNKNTHIYFILNEPRGIRVPFEWTFTEYQVQHLFKFI